MWAPLREHVPGYPGICHRTLTVYQVSFARDLRRRAWPSCHAPSLATTPDRFKRADVAAAERGRARCRIIHTYYLSIVAPTAVLIRERHTAAACKVFSQGEREPSLPLRQLPFGACYFVPDFCFLHAKKKGGSMGRGDNRARGGWMESNRAGYWKTVETGPAPETGPTFHARDQDFAKRRSRRLP